jgi:hypothetical protein
MARSMLAKYNVSDSYWAEAINTACHSSNRLYCRKLLKKTPYELLIGRKPNISLVEIKYLIGRRPKYVFFSSHIFRGSNLYYIEQ